MRHGCTDAFPGYVVTAALTVLLFGALGSCGDAPLPSEAAHTRAIPAAMADTLVAKIDWQRVPLTQADVQLYLDVMRAAAERLRHPSAADLAAPKLAKAAAAKMQQGHPERVTTAEDQAIDLAGTLQGHADDLIVADRHIDAERYSHIVDRVEDAVVPPQFDIGADGGEPLSTPYVPTARDRAVAATRAANIKLLAPHRKEIRALQSVVRDTTPKDASP